MRPRFWHEPAWMYPSCIWHYYPQPGKQIGCKRIDHLLVMIGNRILIQLVLQEGSKGLYTPCSSSDKLDPENGLGWIKNKHVLFGGDWTTFKAAYWLSFCRIFLNILGMIGTYMGVSENSGTPKSSHWNRMFHYKNHPFWGIPIVSNTHICQSNCLTTKGLVLRTLQFRFFEKKAPGDCWKKKYIMVHFHHLPVDGVSKN